MDLVFDLFIVSQILCQLCIRTKFQPYLRGVSYTGVFIGFEFLFCVGELLSPDLNFETVKNLMEMYGELVLVTVCFGVQK